MLTIASLTGLWICVAAAVGLAVLGVVSWIRSRSFTPIVGVILLQRRRVTLDEGKVADLARRALGAEVSAADDTLRQTRVDGEPVFLVWRGHHGIEVAASDIEPDALPVEEALPDDLSEAVRSVRAHLALRLLGHPRKAGYEALIELARVFREVLDDNTRAIVRLDEQSLIVCNDALRRRLTGSGATATFLGLLDLPIHVPQDDPALQAAIAEARRRWPEFLASWQQGDTEADHAVKARLSEGEESEHVWVEVEAIEGGRVRGRILSVPAALSIEAGSAIDVDAAEITDWSIVRGTEQEGAFTESILDRWAEEQEPPPAP